MLKASVLKLILITIDPALVLKKLAVVRWRDVDVCVDASRRRIGTSGMIGREECMDGAGLDETRAKWVPFCLTV